MLSAHAILQLDAISVEANPGGDVEGKHWNVAGIANTPDAMTHQDQKINDRILDKIHCAGLFVVAKSRDNR